MVKGQIEQRVLGSEIAEAKRDTAKALADAQVGMQRAMVLIEQRGRSTAEEVQAIERKRVLAR